MYYFLFIVAIMFLSYIIGYSRGRMDKELEMSMYVKYHMRRLYNNYRALIAGQKIYYVPALNRMCFASSIYQCRAKFIKTRSRQANQYHRIIEPNIWFKIRFVLFGTP